MQIEATRLLRAFKAVEPAISEDFSRSNICRLLVEVSDKACTIVSTDGHTLHKATIAGENGAPWTVEITPTCVALLLRALRGAKGEAELSPESCKIGATAVALEIADDGAHFPPYAQIIPSDNPLLGAENGGPRGFDPEYLGRACKAIALYGADMRCFFGAALDPCKLRVEDAGDTFEAIIMPRRI